MRGFLYVGMFCRVPSSTIASFCVCTTIVTNLERNMKAIAAQLESVICLTRINGNAIGTGNLFDSDIA